MIRYEERPAADIDHLFEQGKREGLSFVPGTAYIAALEGNRIIGFAGMKMRGSQVTLRNLYLLPDYRGRGIGKALVMKQLDWAKRSGARTAVAFSNWNSKHIYAAMGGVEDPGPRYYGKMTFRLGDS